MSQRFSAARSLTGVRWVIVPAAGAGHRMGSTIPKQYLPLAGRCVMSVTLSRVSQAWPTAELLLCLSAQDAHFSLDKVPAAAQWQRINGGAERADSVWAGLKALEGRAQPHDWIAVHDVARPCVRATELVMLANALQDDPVGGLLAVPSSDTMKRAVAGQQPPRVAHTESRVDLWHALTPQLFRYDVLVRAMRDAYQTAEAKGCSIANTITDEASAVEALGLTPRLVAGRRDNLKITYPEDLALAEHIIAAQYETQA